MAAAGTSPSRARRLCLVFAILCGLSATSCSSGPNPSEVHAATGTWVGTITDSQFGAGTFRLVLPVPDEGLLVGTFSATFPLDRRVEGVASSPSLVPDRLSLSLDCGAGSKVQLFTTIVGTRMTGGFVSLGCTTLVQGSVDLARQ